MSNKVKSNFSMSFKSLFGKLTLGILFVTFIFLTSCDRTKNLNQKGNSTSVTKQVTPLKYPVPHEYGGWYCPDNFGFPPVDIYHLDKVPVVNGRMPTEKETQNGTSLIFVDKTKYPDAKALDMTLPRLARIYTEHNKMFEMIIVIQAAVIGKDSIVGYRFPNGGNGSAWFGEVTFLTDEEMDEIGPSPFVYLDSEIDASKEQIWNAFIKTPYAKKLGENFNQAAFFNSPWTPSSQVRLNLSTNGMKANGIVTTLWGNLYMQIDYDIKGFHYSEKLLILENNDNGSAEMHFAAGPFPDNFDKEQIDWSSWFKDVKAMSEKK